MLPRFTQLLLGAIEPALQIQNISAKFTRKAIQTTILFSLILAVTGIMLAACGNIGSATKNDPLIIYSGRSESLVNSLIEQFETDTGIDVEVRYGDTAELAATLLEEGQNSRADVFFAQDPGGLGAVADAGLLAQLPEETLKLVDSRVDSRFADPEGEWIGVSGRARTIVYNTETLTPADLPEDMIGFTDPQWKGRIGLPPTNASFQTMVTAMRNVWGEEKTRFWLEGIMTNEPVFYEKNTPTVAAVGAGEVEVGFVNHYYLYRFLAEEGESFTARNYFLPSGGPGSLVMVAGVSQLSNSQNKENGLAFIEYLLSETAQTYFAKQTYEYPLVPGVSPSVELTPLEELNTIQIDLSDLSDIQGSVRLLQEVGMLP